MTTSRYQQSVDEIVQSVKSVCSLMHNVETIHMYDTTKKIRAMNPGEMICGALL